MTERVAILVDGNNMAHGGRRHGVILDYSAFLLWASQGGPRKPNGQKVKRTLTFPRHVVMARVYLGPSHNGDGDGRRKSFIKLVEEAGFEVRVCAEEGNSNKTAVDRDIIFDALALAYRNRVDRILLLSGDGGFTRLVETLKVLGVQVEVCAFPDTSRALREAADQFWDLTSLSGVTLVRGRSSGNGSGED